MMFCSGFRGTVSRCQHGANLKKRKKCSSCGRGCSINIGVDEMSGLRERFMSFDRVALLVQKASNHEKGRSLLLNRGQAIFKAADVIAAGMEEAGAFLGSLESHLKITLCMMKLGHVTQSSSHALVSASPFKLDRNLENVNDFSAGFKSTTDVSFGLVQGSKLLKSLDDMSIIELTSCSNATDAKSLPEGVSCLVEQLLLHLEHSNVRQMVGPPNKLDELQSNFDLRGGC